MYGSRDEIAALQLALGSQDEAQNIAATVALVEEAAARGAQIILPSSLPTNRFS